VSVRRHGAASKRADECIVRIDALAAGGDGIGREPEGRVVFVPYAAPGERVRVRIDQRRRRYAHATLIEVLEPGPARVEPRCEWFGECGGCSWQHVDYPAQLEAKAGIVRDALVRIGGFALEAPPPIHASPRPYGYRGRTRVSVEGGRVGFRRRRSNELCATGHCPVLLPELDRELARLARQPPARDGEWELAAAGGTPRAVDLAHPEGPRLVLESAGERVETSPGVFFQANALLLGLLIDRVLERCGSGERCVELYAGAGLFTLPLARRFESLLAVEGHEAASADLARNLRSAGLGAVDAREAPMESRNASVECREAPVESVLRELAGQAPDVLLLDPPRTGLPPRGAEDLVAVGARRVVYLSCDPATQARDLRTLREAGYALESLEAFDLFPQTPHVEALATLTSSL